MRNSGRPFRLNGVSRAQCRGPHNPRTASLREMRKSGPADACTFDTLNVVRSLQIGLEHNVRGDRPSGQGADCPPVTASGLNPLPARSNSLDNVDGGPDARFYIQIGII